MNILCVADNIDPLIYSSSVKTRLSVELIISSGDLPMKYLGFLASSFNKPVLFVFGNHNLTYLRSFKLRDWQFAPPNKSMGSLQIRDSFGARYINNRVTYEKNLLIAGLGGSPCYNMGENQYTEFQMFCRILALVPRLLWNRLVHGRFLDILVTHTPPRNINDLEDRCHQGFRCFLLFMRLFKPAYLLHGHVHLYNRNAPRRQRYHKTEVINVYNHFLLEWNDND